MRGQRKTRRPLGDDLVDLGRYWMKELARASRSGWLEPETNTLPGEGAGSFPVRSPTMEQTFWLYFGVLGRIPASGCVQVDVYDARSCADAAILAALLVMEGRPTDVGRLRKAFGELSSSESGGAAVDVDSRLTIASEAHTGGRLPEILRDARQRRLFEFVLLLLGHYRPGFERMPRRHREALLANTCTYINDYLESLRRLLAFLEHGTPGRGTIAAATTADRAVKAVVLKDVYGLTHREVGEELDISPPEDFGLKRDHLTVRKMVGRGREILERTFGREGWEAKAAAMREQMSGKSATGEARES